MRLILTILLIGLFKADAQMVINASEPYRPMVSANLLLDDYPNAAAAYSLRKLDKDYSGSAIRVRRSNDNAESDIGFTSSSDLDTAALKTFVGANSGFVVTWYDQSGNSRNASRATAANQPRIVNAGIVEREGTKPSVFFDGSNDYLNRSSAYTVNQPGNVFITCKRNTSANVMSYFQLRQSIANSAFSNSSLNDTTATIFSGTLLSGTPKNLTNLSLINNLFNTTSSTIRFNGTQIASGGCGTRNGAAESIIGASGNGIGGYELYTLGKISEIVFYPSNQSSNNTGIESNINTYYGIY